MKKSISIVAAILLGLSVSTAAFAQESAPAQTERRQIVEGVFVNHSYTPGMLGSMDSLIITKDAKEQSIFESEGRRIENVYSKDFDNDGNTEYLVQMDGGGSGGYRDMSLLKLSAENTYKPVWEDSYPMPEVEIKDRDDGKSAIYINYIKNPKDEKALKALVIVNFNKEGKITTRDSQELSK